ncbi:major capsid protein [Tortoise microvirus 43]|nr:major capsid protein [Tortoise microvirus 43]
MKNLNRLSTAPLRTPRTRRNHAISVLTSLPAGKMVPVAAVPMLREDAMTARVRIAVEMQETAEILMNGVDLRATAYLVPWLAFDRFQGSRDQFDRSYSGIAKDKDPGSTTTAFIEVTAAAGPDGSNPVHKYLGLHTQEGQMENRGYLESYNAIWNYRAKNRSLGINPRDRLETSLAPAFWNHSQFQHIVPDFDQAVIDGEVALEYASNRIQVHGIATDGEGVAVDHPYIGNNDGALHLAQANEMYTTLARRTPLDGAPAVFAELEEGGLKVSLANIEMARKTQAFAKMRERFEGHDDEYIIDMLMDGLSIPDQALKQPILLANKLVRFTQAKRYATDSGNLAESAVSGGAVLDLAVRVPRLSTGGVVMVLLEAVPQQLFERQADWYLSTTAVEQLPEFMRDELDPEKVDVVTMKQIDSDHATPDATFGYEPLNAKYNRAGARVGGKFFRPSVDSGTDTDRQRLWAVETANPTLAEDFYIVRSIHTKPFLDTESDPFEATLSGNAVLEGNTVFGGVLVEATNNYEKVAEKAPTQRIEKAE